MSLLNYENRDDSRRKYDPISRCRHPIVVFADRHLYDLARPAAVFLASSAALIAIIAVIIMVASWSESPALPSFSAHEDSWRGVSPYPR